MSLAAVDDLAIQRAKAGDLEALERGATVRLVESFERRELPGKHRDRRHKGLFRREPVDPAT